MLAHVGGVPVEEMLIPSAAGSGTALLIARTWLSFRLTRRREAARRRDAAATARSRRPAA
jgi:hypothetical protein